MCLFSFSVVFRVLNDRYVVEELFLKVVLLKYRFSDLTFCKHLLFLVLQLFALTFLVLSHVF